MSDYVLDIPREKWFNYLQTVETLIRHCSHPLGVFRLQWVKVDLISESRKKQCLLSVSIQFKVNYLSGD